ncbi:hypothetical protein [Streptomyces sp. CB03911]|uniref:hypothetical protein n=1 Tax=Streptomyces sp. CB03911 TaxID=1804758 RepID=UPI00093E6E33|nr:hypothetical protein [Streptomyces sp. CB03911]OKI26228.1 hypothetical protein A6A07_30130 [Streptomyces sp. CB03911]
MEGYNGTATLEWWANPSTCLGCFSVTLTVSVVGGWRGVAIPVTPMSASDGEGFDFLMQLDPVFTLRFPDDSTVLVNVIAERTSEGLTLGPAESGEPAGWLLVEASPAGE